MSSRLKNAPPWSLARAAALAETSHLDSREGVRVFGTAFSPDEISDLAKASDGAVSLRQCYITDEAAVRAWAGEVTVKTTGSIDLVIKQRWKSLLLARWRFFHSMLSAVSLK